MLLLALLLGFAGSLHCAGMCGPLVLAIPTASRPMLGRAVYHGGRLGTYTVLGAAFGLVGRSLAVAGLQRGVSIILGALLVLGAVTAWRWPGTTLMVRWMGRLKSLFRGLLARRTLGSLFALGALNGLLPCGLVYVAATTAAATGGILSAMAYMAAFGVGTLPMLLGLTLAGRVVPAWRIARWRPFMPACITLVGVLLVLRGMSLGIPYLSPVLGGVGGGSCCH